MEKLKNSFKEERNVSVAGSIFSGAGGAALVALAVRNLGKGSPLPYLELLSGAYLLFRGITSYCPITAAIEHEYPLKPKS